MNPIGWLLALLLTGAVVGLAVVPYFRAGFDAGGRDGPLPDVAQDIERVLEREYCLECGGKLDRWNLPRCPHCGAERRDGQ